MRHRRHCGAATLEEELLRIATYWWGGKRHVGRLSEDGRDVQPLALGPLAERRGALALIEAMAEGKPAARPAGAKLPLSAIKLDAPIPLGYAHAGVVVETGRPGGPSLDRKSVV